MTAGRAGRAAATTTRTRRPTTPARRSASPPSRLTLTFGFGPSCSSATATTASASPRRRPAALADLPAFADDALDPTDRGGDLCVQACADDPQVAFHAVRNLARIGRGARRDALVAARLRPHVVDQPRAGARRATCMGFKDGTNNIKLEDTAALAQHVWVGARRRPGVDARRHATSSRAGSAC